METYTLADVQKHNTSTDAWIIIHNKGKTRSCQYCFRLKLPQNANTAIPREVYNVSNYLEDHPGGAALLVEVAGKDATEEFVEAGHSEDADDVLEGLCIGHLPEEVRQLQSPPASPCFFSGRLTPKLKLGTRRGD